MNLKISITIMAIIIGMAYAISPDYCSQLKKIKREGNSLIVHIPRDTEKLKIKMIFVTSNDAINPNITLNDSDANLRKAFKDGGDVGFKIDFQPFVKNIQVYKIRINKHKSQRCRGVPGVNEKNITVTYRVKLGEHVQKASKKTKTDNTISNPNEETSKVIRNVDTTGNNNKLPSSIKKPAIETCGLGDRSTNYYPWFVNIKFKPNDNYSCPGILINSRIAMTDPNCIANNKGKYDTDNYALSFSNGVSSQVLDIEFFTGEYNRKELAIVRFTEITSDVDLKPICLTSGYLNNGTVIFFSQGKSYAADVAVVKCQNENFLCLYGRKDCPQGSLFQVIDGHWSFVGIPIGNCMFRRTSTVIDWLIETFEKY